MGRQAAEDAKREPRIGSVELFLGSGLARLAPWRPIFTERANPVAAVERRAYRPGEPLPSAGAPPIGAGLNVDTGTLFFTAGI